MNDHQLITRQDWIDALVGITTALVTPFNDEGKIDWSSLRKLCLNLQAPSGIASLLILGSTGEAMTLTRQERTDMIKRVKAYLKGMDLPLMVGTGHACTRTACELTEHACRHGADLCLVVTPYYNRPSPAGLLKHFHEVAEASDCPIILYHVPSRTGCHLPLEVVQELATHPNIIGMKDATASLDWVETISDQTDDFLCLSGDDASFTDYILHGGDGLISVVSNLFPHTLMQHMQALVDWDEEKEAEPELPLGVSRLIEVLGAASNPMPIKWALWYRGLIQSPQCRLPLHTLDIAKQHPLRLALDHLEQYPW